MESTDLTPNFYIPILQSVHHTEVPGIHIYLLYAHTMSFCILAIYQETDYYFLLSFTGCTFYGTQLKSIDHFNYNSTAKKKFLEVK